jgi:hypothetical protein
MAADDRIDELFAGPAEDFISRRDALAKELKVAGDKDGAAEVKKLRRPTVAAWAVNQLSHKHPGKLTALDEVAEQLRDAHEALLDGKGNDAVRAATAERRKVIKQLADLAVDAIGPSGEAQREAVAHTLDAAVADLDAAEAVRAGRLSKELEAPSGFAGLSFAADAPARGPGARPTTETSPSPKREERAATSEERAAARERGQAEAEAKSRERELKQRTAEAERTAAAAQAASDEVERLEHRLADARDRLTETQQRAVRAQKALDDMQ